VYNAAVSKQTVQHNHGVETFESYLNSKQPAPDSGAIHRRLTDDTGTPVELVT
jgi:hypothetical protein